MEGAGEGAGDKLVKETMVASGFMFKLFFIKSNLRFHLSSLFLSFFIKWCFDLLDPGPSAPPRRLSPRTRNADLSLAVGPEPPLPSEPHRRLKKIKWSPSVFAVLVNVAWTSDFPRL